MILVAEPHKLQFGRYRHKYEDNIKMGLTEREEH
jgi:hypothetical protein